MRIASINGVQYNNVSSASKTNLNNRTEQGVSFGVSKTQVGIIASALSLGVSACANHPANTAKTASNLTEKEAQAINAPCIVDSIVDIYKNKWVPDTTSVRGYFANDSVFVRTWNMLNTKTGKVEKDAVEFWGETPDGGLDYIIKKNPKFTDGEVYVKNNW